MNLAEVYDEHSGFILFQSSLELDLSIFDLTPRSLVPCYICQSTV